MIYPRSSKGVPAGAAASSADEKTLNCSSNFSNLEPRHERYLEQFVPINTGDLVLLPAYTRRYEVHLGIVVPPRQPARP
jgi:hypothetical protein